MTNQAGPYPIPQTAYVATMPPEYMHWTEDRSHPAYGYFCIGTWAGLRAFTA